MNRFKTALLTTVTAFAFSASALTAHADETTYAKTVYGGGKVEDGSYYSGTLVPKLLEAMTQDPIRVSGYSWYGPTQGSLDNMERITANPLGIGFAQLDMAKANLTNPSYHYVIANERVSFDCYYLASPITAYAQKGWGAVLDDAGLAVSIATLGPKSGSMGSLQALMTIYPQLKDVEIVNYASAKEAIAAVVAGKQTFFWGVSRPTPGVGFFKLIADAKLTYVPVADWEMQEALGVEFYKLPVTDPAWGILSSLGGDQGQFVETGCTPTAIITGDPAQLSADRTSQKKLVTELGRRIGLLPESTFAQSTGIAGAIALAKDRVVELARQAGIAQ